MKKTGFIYQLHFLLFLGVIFSILFSLFIPNTALAKKRSRKSSPNWEFRISMSATYDANILRYSDKYLDRFRNNEDEGRFNINSSDDLIWQNSMQISRAFRFIGKQKSTISTEIRYKAYTHNSIKDWSYFYLGWRQNLSSKAALSISYSYIPNYYVRNYRDEDWVNKFGYTPETFQRFEFEKDNFFFWIQNRFFKNTLIRLSFAYMQYFHNKHFTEYDSDNLFYGVNLYQQVHRKLKLNVGYRFITSDARGHDEPNESRESSDDSDPTYDEDVFILGFGWQLPRIFGYRNDLDVEMRYEQRYYSTIHFLEFDPLHAGRKDNYFSFQVNYELRLKPNLNIGGFFGWNLRDSSTTAEENKTYISDEKDFNQYQVGVEITYSFRL